MYVLECRDGSLYAGMTNDLRRRMTLHTAGKGAKYTRVAPAEGAGGAVALRRRTAAARLEYAFKTLPREKKRTLLAAPERVTELFPALAGCVYEPVRDVTLEGILNG